MTRPVPAPLVASNDSMPVCEHCNGARHVKTPSGQTPCVCLVRSRVLLQTPTLLRQTDQCLPESVIHCNPWPLTDSRHEFGEWNAFRRQAWWSIANIAARTPVRVVACPTLRLREIQFDRDPEFPSLFQLAEPDLVILVELGAPDMLRNTLADLTRSVCELRATYAKPTWLFSPGSPYTVNVTRTTVMPTETPALPAGHSNLHNLT